MACWCHTPRKSSLIDSFQHNMLSLSCTPHLLMYLSPLTPCINSSPHSCTLCQPHSLPLPFSSINQHAVSASQHSMLPPHHHRVQLHSHTSHKHTNTHCIGSDCFTRSHSAAPTPPPCSLSSCHHHQQPLTCPALTYLTRFLPP